MIKLDIHVGGNSFGAEVDNLEAFPDLVPLVKLWLLGPPKGPDIPAATARITADVDKLNQAADSSTAIVTKLDQTGV